MNKGVCNISAFYATVSVAGQWAFPFIDTILPKPPRVVLVSKLQEIWCIYLNQHNHSLVLVLGTRSSFGGLFLPLFSFRDETL
ncbi:unnamed protein product [Lasius platythorax]|uniref:Uncharacterized protein n=1 Tax=Lasius platythorax TaxID=488582 RepID=A0AAV2N552_9HYME